MESIIKPFSVEYTKGCADLLQYLWKENKEARIKHFEWEYLNNPNCANQPLAVIAVDLNDNVIGFRGFYISSFYINGVLSKVASIADTVVSPNARRMGIFQKMNKYSLGYLHENGISLILDLGPSWAPYYGYKKIGFDDLSEFNSVYKFNFFSLFRKLILNQKRLVLKKNNYTVEKKGITYVISSTIPFNVLFQIPDVKIDSKIVSVKNNECLNWRINHPGAKYVYAYALNLDNELISFFWFKTADGYLYNLGICSSNSTVISRCLFKFFLKECNPGCVAAWVFGINNQTRRLYNKLGFIKIPFLNKFRKNPPALIRTLKTKIDGSLDWSINGLDIRKISNWELHKFDGDSF